MARFAFYFLFLIFFSFTIATIQSCGGSSTSPSPDFGIASQNCGNGSIDAVESCDDGNVNNSDGCNSNCAWEVGQAICGNGVKENEECCDDGNNLSGDGCSSVCTSEQNNRAPAVPQLSLEPANGVTWAPTRLYLSWNPSVDLDVGDQVTYDVYFIQKGGRETIPAGILPYKTGILSNHFIIQSSTDNRAEYFPDQVSAIYLSPDTSYLWKVCARDSSGAQNCSETRTFNTDNSVVGWWRFDENPVGMVCPGILGGPAGDAGETVCDYSGFGNHGVPNGGVTWLVPPMAGILGGALQFDGVDDSVTIQNVPMLNPVSVSVQSKFKVAATGEQQIVDKRTMGFGYNLRVQRATFPMELVFIIFGDPGEPIAITARQVGLIAQNTNYLITGVYQDATKTASLYNSSTLLATDSLVGFSRTIPSAIPLTLGNLSYFEEGFYGLNGSCDETIIYNKALLEAEIANSSASEL